MSILDGRRNSDQAADRPSAAAAPFEDTVWAPSHGAYITNGAKLFHVEHTLWDNIKGEPFLELEDCDTLEVVLCPAREVTALGLRSVTPAVRV
jgi:hypothetical protein